METRWLSSDGYNVNFLETCNLRIRLAETLQRHGFKHVTDLDKLTDEQILALEGVGKAGLQQIRDEIALLSRPPRSMLQ